MAVKVEAGRSADSSRSGLATGERTPTRPRAGDRITLGSHGNSAFQPITASCKIVPQCQAPSPAESPGKSFQPITMSCKIVSGGDVSAGRGFLLAFQSRFKHFRFFLPSRRLPHLHPEPLPAAPHAHHLHPRPQQTERLVGPQQPLHHRGQAGWHGYLVRRLRRYASSARRRSAALMGRGPAVATAPTQELKTAARLPPPAR